MRSAVFGLGVALATATLTASAASAPLRIAAAADLADCLPALDRAFRQTVPNARIETVLGSSGNFYTQIVDGAPFDVFLSADVGYARKLIAAGSALPSSLTPYATGRLVLWTTDPRLDPHRGYALLRDPAVRHIALANPAHAPYGRAAQAALQRAGLWQALQGRLVFGENVGQAAQFVASGNAQAGLVALALLAGKPQARGDRFWLIPQRDYPPLIQAAVVTVHGRDQPLAARYLAFLRSPQARAVLQRFGFGAAPR